MKAQRWDELGAKREIHWYTFTSPTLVSFGWRHSRDVLLSRSGRARFGTDDDPHRAVVLHQPAARGRI